MCYFREWNKRTVKANSKDRFIRVKPAPVCRLRLLREAEKAEEAAATVAKAACAAAVAAVAAVAQLKRGWELNGFVVWVVSRVLEI